MYRSFFIEASLDKKGPNYVSTYSYVYNGRYEVSVIWNEQDSIFIGSLHDLNLPQEEQCLLCIGQDENQYQDLTELEKDLALALKEFGIEGFSVPDEFLEDLDEPIQSEVVDLGVSDEEYLAALATGIDLRAQHDALGYAQNLIQRIQRYQGTTRAGSNSREFEQDAIQSSVTWALTQIGRHEQIIDGDGNIDLKTVDALTKKYFGTAFSKFPEMIKDGKHPLTHEQLEEASNIMLPFHTGKER